MSSLIVEICTVEEILPHENADLLEVAKVKGWHCIVPKDKYVPGDLCVYFPPDSILPGDLARYLDVEKYLKKLPKDAYGERPDAGRVGVAKLRGVPSYGLVTAVEGVVPEGLVPFKAGIDVADILGIEKYEPPEPTTDGEAEKDHPLFHRYTAIENIKNFPDVFEEGEFVIFTEKIHGKNVRLGYVREQDGDRIKMAGSHNIRRKEFHSQNGMRSEFWKCWDSEGLNDMVVHLGLITGGGQIVVFGELYGCGVQDMWYGHPANNTSFAVFDISINGRYINHDEIVDLCDMFNINKVPTLYAGPFSMDLVEQFTNGDTVLCEPEIAGKFVGREGIVIRPEKETIAPTMGARRKILKSISFDYLNRKGGTEYK